MDATPVSTPASVSACSGYSGPHKLLEVTWKRYPQVAEGDDARHVVQQVSCFEVSTYCTELEPHSLMNAPHHALYFQLDLDGPLNNPQENVTNKSAYSNSGDS